MQKLRSVFTRNMKQRRKKINLSQEALAEKCDLHRTYISSVELGKRNISIDNIEKIATALEIEAYLLLKEDSSHE